MTTFGPRSRKLSSWGAVLLAVVAMSILPASPAVALDYNYCGAGAQDVQDGAWGYWAGPYAHMHTGPRTGCNITYTATGRLDYHCWVANPDTGTTWTYLELADYPGPSDGCRTATLRTAAQPFTVCDQAASWATEASSIVWVRARRECEVAPAYGLPL